MGRFGAPFSLRGVVFLRQSIPCRNRLKQHERKLLLLGVQCLHEIKRLEQVAMGSLAFGQVPSCPSGSVERVSAGVVVVFVIVLVMGLLLAAWRATGPSGRK